MAFGCAIKFGSNLVNKLAAVVHWFAFGWVGSIDLVGCGLQEKAHQLGGWFDISIRTSISSLCTSTPGRI